MIKKNIYILVGIFLVIVAIAFAIYINKTIKTPKEESLEHIISIKSNDKKINAVTGSFCYKNGACIDKVDFQEFNYDPISTYFDNRLYIENIDGIIESIEVFDLSTKKFISPKIEFSDDYIVTPSISGTYIFKINARYESKPIEYYFMAYICEISGENINIDLKIKEGTLSNKGLTMIAKNLSDKDLEYGNPYTIEKYENGYWQSVETKNDIIFTLPAYGLKKNQSVEIKIDWEYGYGKLKGKYRIVKSFSYKEKDKYISFYKYLEFEI